MSILNTKMCSLSPNLLPLEQKKQISLPRKLRIEQQHHQQYALKWSDFQSSILNCFQRLRDEEDFVDVTLSCDQRTFAAHRIVLSACSPYFRNLLKSNPCKHPIVILRDVHSDNMECLLSFMYNGEVNVRHDQLPDFLKTAHLLQIRGLTDVSENWRSSSIFTSNESRKRDADREICNISAAEKFSYFPKYENSSELPMTSTMMSNSKNSSVNAPVIKDTKSSSATSLQWENSEIIRNRKHHLTPPPQKRIKSADLFRAQHGISSERALSEKDYPTFVHQSLTRERRHVEESELSLETSTEGKLQSQNQQVDTESIYEESAGADSSSSIADDYDRDDTQQRIKGSMDHQRTTVHNMFIEDTDALNQNAILNLNDFEFPELPSNIRLKTNTPKNITQPLATILYNRLWNAQYEGMQNKEYGTTSSSGEHTNLSIDSFFAKSTALSLMVKTPRVKNKSDFMDENLIENECQHLRLKNEPKNNELQQQYQLKNQFKKQQPLYAYLYELQKAAYSHQRTLDTNLMAFSGSASMPKEALTTTAIADIDNITNNSNNSYVVTCPLCETPLEQKLFRQHLDDHYPRDSPVCPVIQCSRRFAHPNSVRNHMRIKHTQQWAKMKVMRSSAGPPTSGTDIQKKYETN